MSTFPSISEGGNQWALVSLPRIHSPNSLNTRLVEQPRGDIIDRAIVKPDSLLSFQMTGSTLGHQAAGIGKVKFSRKTFAIAWTCHQAQKVLTLRIITTWDIPWPLGISRDPEEPIWPWACHVLPI
jgi:hypothetical protein